MRVERAEHARGNVQKTLYMAIQLYVYSIQRVKEFVMECICCCSSRGVRCDWGKQAKLYNSSCDEDVMMVEIRSLRVLSTLFFLSTLRFLFTSNKKSGEKKIKSHSLYTWRKKSVFFFSLNRSHEKGVDSQKWIQFRAQKLFILVKKKSPARNLFVTSLYTTQIDRIERAKPEWPNNWHLKRNTKHTVLGNWNFRNIHDHNLSIERMSIALFSWSKIARDSSSTKSKEARRYNMYSTRAYIESVSLIWKSAKISVGARYRWSAIWL